MARGLGRWVGCTFFLILTGGVLGEARAQEHPNLARGFSSDKAYSVGDVDSINLFNGNLTLTIPVGQRYPAGGGLGFQVSLVYNSSLWSYLEASNDAWGGGDAVEAFPSPLFNCGLGWTVSFGRLLPPTRPPENDSDKWVYVSPDGAQHKFYPRLHSDIAAEQSTGVFYTRDNTYLRLKTNTSPMTVEFPDGSIHEFSGVEYGVHGLPGYGVTKIRDRNAAPNWIAFSYSNALDWTVTDRFGRMQHIEFTDHDPGSGKMYVVSKVRLVAFGGAEAVYTFAYDAWTEIDRTTKDTWWGNNVPVGSPAAADPVRVSLLKSITGPEGLVWSSLDAIDGGADYDRGDPAAARDFFSGLIESLTLPTRGRLSWTWRNWAFPQSSKSYRDQNAGVSSRTQTDSVRGLAGTWAYSSALYTPAGQANPTEQISTVVDPVGHTTRHYFWADLDNSGDGDWDYGLPFTYRTVGTSSCGTSCNGLLLSRELIPAGQSNAMRSWWVRYEHDTFPTGVGSGEDFWNTNRRSAAERARIHDDATYAGAWRESVSSDFDGYGHYRIGDERGNFATTLARQSTTEFNPATGCYPACGGFTPIAPASPWVLGTYTERRQSEGAWADVQEYEFDPANGLLTCERRRKSATQRTARDVVVQFGYDTSGQATHEEWRGGDTGSASTGSLCGGSGYSYRLDHTYASGVRTTSRYRNPANGQPLSFYVLDTEVDASTALVSTSWDTAGFRSTFVYDQLGRLTEDRRPGDGGGTYDDGAKTFVTWSFGSSNAPATVTLFSGCPTGMSGCTASSFGESEWHYDGFGRLLYEKVRRPDGTLAKRRHLVNEVGWKTALSEYTGNSSSSYADTLFQNFDALGRAGRIRPPEGSAHDITVSYQGERLVQQTVKIGTALAGTESSKTTTEEFDPFGRLVKVTEPSEGVVATYEYDAASRLRHVDLLANSTHQHRWFEYDGRGFLVSETHPEKNGANVTFGDYDALGHAGRRDDTSASRRTAFLYNAAERLLEVREPSASNRLLKRFDYEGAAGYSAGKLHVAEAWNYPPSGSPYPEVKVTATYGYEGREGRVSSKSTSLSENGVATETFDHTFAWSPGGELVSQGYPRCLAGACAPDAPAALNQTYGYTHGHLTSVPGWATAIGYHRSGMVASVLHGNGTLDEIAADPEGRARPASIAVTAKLDFDDPLSVVWSTGAFGYDGAGNLKAIGADRFRYDGVSRLLEAEIVSGGATHTQALTFDGFGNLTSIANDGSTRITDTSKSTNRLTTGSYDEAGNLTAWAGNVYSFDVLNRMTRLQSGGEDWFYAYDADDERIVATNADRSRTTWTLRGLGQEVVARVEKFPPGGAVTPTPPPPCPGPDGIFCDDFELGGLGAWSSTSTGQTLRHTDYFWRGPRLLAAAVAGEETRHLSLDHLGTPRVITNDMGELASRHDYFPFGEEITSDEQDGEVMKFTGHERDRLATAQGPNATADDLDYMHARFNAPLTARFLSVDGAPSWQPSQPQSWNRYTYVHGKPLVARDPTGLVLQLFGSAEEIQAMIDILNSGLNGFEVRVDAQGIVALVATDSSGDHTEAQAAMAELLGAVIEDSKTTSLSLVSGDTDAMPAHFDESKIDVSDVRAFGEGPGPTQAAVALHEIIEQYGKQVKGATQKEAHDFGIRAENAAGGYIRRSNGDLRILGGGSAGRITSIYDSRTGIPIKVVVVTMNGNILGVEHP